MKFTDITINAMKAPVEGAVAFYDDTLPGFGVRVSQAGTKSFILTHGSRRHRETIGRVGIIALKDARKEAKRRLAEYTLGKHQPRAVSWDRATELFLVDVKERCRDGTCKEYKRVLKKHFPFGDARLSSVSVHDLQRDLDRCDSRSERFHAFVYLRAFLRWAYRRHYLEHNPIDRMTVTSGSKPRERVLTTDELRNVWNAAGDDTFGHIVKLLILTGQRVGETTKLERSMLGDNVITFPNWLTKNGREHTLPIGEYAKSILAKQSQNDRKLLFVGCGNPRAIFRNFSNSKTALDKRSEVFGWTLHDLRRTFASGLAAQGVSLPVIERILNHVSGSFGGIVGVYQRYNYMPEMRTAIETWEKHIQALVA